jgi:hypothetical protein
MAGKVSSSVGSAVVATPQPKRRRSTGGGSPGGMVSLDDADSLTVEDVAAIEANNMVLNHLDAIDNDMQEYEIVALLNDLRDESQNENERACMDAIFYLFEQREDIELLNKRAVFVYMRDMSSLSPKQLSSAMSVIRRRYRELISTGQYDIY